MKAAEGACTVTSGEGGETVTCKKEFKQTRGWGVRNHLNVTLRLWNLLGQGRRTCEDHKKKCGELFHSWPFYPMGK